MRDIDQRHLDRRHLRLCRADAEARAGRRRGIARTERRVSDPPRASAESVPRGVEAGVTAHVVRAFARRATRVSAAALVVGGSLSPLSHGSVPARNIAALRQHRHRLLAVSVAIRDRDFAGDHGDRIDPQMTQIKEDKKLPSSVFICVTCGWSAQCAAATTRRRSASATSDARTSSSPMCGSSCGCAR
jgi:hypothetical protein